MRRFVCVVCPKSCEITAEMRGSELRARGNACGRGAVFAEQEISDPQRILTTTVKLTSGGLLPVRSRGTVKKGELKDLVGMLKTVTVAPPVELGQIVLPSADKVSSDIIASDTAT